MIRMCVLGLISLMLYCPNASAFGCCGGDGLLSRIKAKIQERKAQRAERKSNYSAPSASTASVSNCGSCLSSNVITEPFPQTVFVDALPAGFSMPKPIDLAYQPYPATYRSATVPSVVRTGSGVLQECTGPNCKPAVRTIR